MQAGYKFRVPKIDTPQPNMHIEYWRLMAIPVVEFSNGGYKIRKIFA